VSEILPVYPVPRRITNDNLEIRLFNSTEGKCMKINLSVVVVLTLCLGISATPGFSRSKVTGGVKGGLISQRLAPIRKTILVAPRRPEQQWERS
jgi:hypothetical protein